MMVASVAGLGAADLREPPMHDLVTPESFVVVDVSATVRERALAGELVPVVLRRVAGVETTAAAELATTFRRSRERFLEALEHAFGRRHLDGETARSARFRAFHELFRADSPEMPVPLSLARAWATGDDGEALLARLQRVLRDIYREHLIGEVRAASSVFLVEVGEDVRFRSWGEAARFARTLEAGQVLSREDAAREARRRLDPLERPLAPLLAGVIRANCVEDVFLTALVVGDRLGERAVRRRFRAGERIVAAGEAGDRWARLAVEFMTRAGIEPLETTEIARDEASHGGRPGATPEREPIPWWVLLTACGGIAVGCAFLVARRRHRRRPGGALARVEAPAADLKAAVAPHLARELKDKLVRVLYSQRGVLLANEAAASRRVAELETRLAQLQPAIAAKIRDYERRIAALEAQLAEKDAETRDLIRARLALARKALDEEIARQRGNWRN